MTEKALKLQPPAFHALHAIYHERDFRVRVNDPTVNMVKRILLEECPSSSAAKLGTIPTCPACYAGYDFNTIQPNNEDRKR